MAPPQIVKSRLVLNLVLLAVLVGLGLFAYLRPETQQAATFPLSSLARDEVTTIRVGRSGQPAVELFRQGNGWQMRAPFSARVDSFQVDRLLDIVQASSRHKLARENLDGYGLDPAQVTVTLNDQEFRFGAINEVTNEQYLATADAVYLVAPYIGYGIPYEIERYFSHRLLGEQEVPVAFAFRNWSLVKDEQGSWTVSGAPPRPAAELSADDINQWVSEWQLASSLRTEPYAGSAAIASDVTVTLKDGRKLEFGVLARESEVVLLRRDENMRFQFGADAGARLLDPFRVASSR